MTLDFSKPITFKDMRLAIQEFWTYSPESKAFWDLITCLRGPDHPSERGDMMPGDASIAYDGRRKRKRETVEVIRGKAFGGVVPGAARSRTDVNYVLVPPPRERDHFDRHVVETAALLGIEVRVKAARVGIAVKATEPTEALDDGDECLAAPSDPLKSGSPTNTVIKWGDLSLAPALPISIPKGKWGFFWDPNAPVGDGTGSSVYITKKEAKEKGFKPAPKLASAPMPKQWMSKMFTSSGSSGMEGITCKDPQAPKSMSDIAAEEEAKFAPPKPAYTPEQEVAYKKWCEKYMKGFAPAVSKEDNG